MNVFLWNARARNGHVEAALNHPFPAQVASDALARGVDLPNVALVVNYDAPRDASNYVHRVGRAARAGKKGTATTLVKRGQEKDFARLRATIAPNKTIPSLKLAGFKALIPDYKACLADLEIKLKEKKPRKPANAERQPPPPPTRERQHAFHQDSAAYAAAFGDLPSATGDGDVTMADAPPSDAHKARVRAILEGVGFKPPRAPR